MDEQNSNSLEHNTADELSMCHKQLMDSEERYQRLFADFDNYRRRIDREKAKIAWESRARVLRGALELVDTIDRAAQALHTQKALLADFDGMIQALAGIELLQKAATRFLEQQGVRPIDQTKHFDPTLHEALAYTYDAEYAVGDIVEIFEKGYVLEGELLRPARVRINESAPNEPASP